jgi:peptidoglycan hydrolase-like protein with peptidoglycan-binding domain
MTLTWPTERRGFTGENVKSVQYLLDGQGASIAVDGSFGPQTEAAVRTFQANRGLTSDGIVGNATWPALIASVSSGSTGNAVRAVQSQIHSRSGSWVTVDGTFGPNTDSSVKVFQADTGLAVDGIVGPMTWNALVSGYLTATDAQTAARRAFDAWTRADRASAGKDAIPSAVAALFARSWSASDGWAFVGCDGAAGTVYCTWRKPGTDLVLAVNDNEGAPFYVVRDATF